MDNSKDFWNQQAEKFSAGVGAVNFDPVGDELAPWLSEKLIGDNEVVCDMGCGNGHTLLYLASKKKKSIFYGVDFAENMIKVANETKEKEGRSNAHFFVCDVKSKAVPGLFDFRFDKIITKRLLINLKGESKYEAIKDVHAMLKDNGTYIMMECFLEPLQRINDIRGKLGLDEIKVKEFNEYLSSDFLERVKDLFRLEKIIDHESLYYFISRVFNASLSNGNPDYHAPINKLAVELVKMGITPMSGYSPEVTALLKKW